MFVWTNFAANKIIMLFDEYILKGSDDGIWQLGLVDFRTLSIIQYSKEH
jgi:hypothetical protein